MRPRRAWASASLTVLLAATACSSGDSGGSDLATFCRSFHDLEDNNPFDGLEVATPLEMEEGFGELDAASESMHDAAPDPLRRYATQYREAVQALVEQLDAASYDPRNLDPSAYRRTTLDYEAATVALSNEATAACE